VRRRLAVETARTGLALSDEPLAVDWLDARDRAVERFVRALLVVGFLAVLALEAYLIVEGLSLL
jgi:hypothetical protein